MTIQKICIFSDLHANLVALKGLIKTADFKSADFRICLGDIVMMGPEPNECVSLLRRKKVICVQGNHDEWIGSMKKKGGRRYGRPYVTKHGEYMVEHIKEKHKDFFESLPKEYALSLAGKNFVFTHYAWRDEGHIVKQVASPKKSDMEKIFRNIEGDYIFHGHEHEPAHLKLKGKEIINVGSLGFKYPAHYFMIEIKKGKIKLEPKTLNYGLEKALKVMKKKKYPGHDFYVRYFYEDYTPDYYRTDTY